MPLYDLICDCGHTKEAFLKLDEQEPVCDRCGLRMKRAMSAPAFHLKGSGWFKDHYGLKQPNKKGGKKDGS
jgi:putative FmdB family regulatory protein